MVRTVVAVVRPTLCALLALCAGVFVMSTVPGVRVQVAFHPVLDGWFQGGAYVLTAAVAIAMAGAQPRTGALRTAWVLVAVALVLRAIAFVLYLGVVRLRTPQPYPSVSDGLWLLMYLPLLAALILIVRAHAPRLTRTLLLDGILGALTAASVALALLYGTLEDLTRPGTPAGALLTNLAYPVLDIALLVVVAGVLVAFGWRPPRAVTMLAIGVAGFAVNDTVFLVQVSAGTFHPGSPLAALSLLATSLIALAGAARDDRDRPTRSATAPGFAVPVVAALLCVATLVVATAAAVGVLAISLATAGLVTAIVRALLTVLGDRDEATAVIAVKDEELLRFQALARASTDFIAMSSVDGMTLWINPAGRRMVGLGPDADVTSIGINDLLPDSARGGGYETRRPTILEQGHWEGESELRDLRGGRPTPVAVSTFVMARSDAGAPLVLGTIQRDISDRIRADRSLRDLVDERQVLLDRLVQAQEDERSSIAADVHDDSVQALAAVELRLMLLRRRLTQNPELVADVDVLETAVSSAMARLRSLLFDLEPPALDTDLGTALRDAASHTLYDLGIRWEVRGDSRAPLDRSARVTAYRVAKEALSNVAKHSGAGRVDIILTAGADVVELTVTDDGVGFEPDSVEARRGHLGLTSMTDRVAVVGGSIELISAPGRGTTVRVRLPIATAQRVP